MLGSAYLMDYINIVPKIETIPAPDKTPAWPGCAILQCASAQSCFTEDFRASTVVREMVSTLVF